MPRARHISALGGIICLAFCQTHGESYDGIIPPNLLGNFVDIEGSELEVTAKGISGYEDQTVSLKATRLEPLGSVT